MSVNYKISNVINRTLAMGYKPMPTVRTALFPEVMLDIEEEQIVDFGNSHLNVHGENFADDADIPEIQVGYSSRTLTVKHRALRARVPYFKEQRAMRADRVRLESRALMEVMRRIDNACEVAAATLATTPGNYSGNTEALAGTDQFTHASSDPTVQFQEAHDAIEDGTLGYKPNVAIMSSDVFNVLKYHPQLYAALSFTVGARQPLSEAQLAQVMGVDRVLVTMHRTLNLSGTAVRTWQNFVLFAYTDFSGDVDGLPTFGVTAKLRDSPFVGGWMDMGNKSHGRDAKVIVSESTQILNPLSGYLLTSVLA